ncbi:MAG: purine-nucleoside phosphorylase [Oscillospiraceae bacterium]|nr:purine-nucleoside phosphorylase [Oscillospiraceae bacterium]
MCDNEKKLYACYDNIRKITDFVPKIAIVLGSGLGGFADDIEVVCAVSYKDIVGFPVSTVPSHKGQFVFGYVDYAPVVIMQGRVHYYEGYSMSDVVLPIRLTKLLGADTIILTNASGGINTDFKVGDFMLMTDHISSFVPSPLIGENFESLGVRFPDMSCVYSKELRDIAEKSAVQIGTKLKKGIYIQTSGPNYESPAEVRLYRALGADAVGMSTACEAIAANHAGMKTCAISCITNMACGITDIPLSHHEVEETGELVQPVFRKLLKQMILNISKESL